MQASFLAYVCYQSGRWEEARDAYERLRKYSERLYPGSRRLANSAYRPLANVYSRLGEYEKARLLLESALEIAIPNGYDTLAANLYSDLSIACRYLGDPERAVALCQQGLALPALPPDEELLLRINLSGHLRTLDRTAEALAQMDSCLALASDNNRDKAYMSSLHASLGSLRADLGRQKEALAAYRQAIALLSADRESHRRDIAKVQLAISHAHLEAGDENAALAAAQEALLEVLPGFQARDPRISPPESLFRLENVISEALTLKGQAWLAKYRRERRPELLQLASSCFASALGLERQMILQYRYQRSQLSRLDYQYDLVQQALDAAWEQHQLAGDSASREQCYAIAAQGKAMLLDEHLGEQEAWAAAGIPYAWQARVTSWREEAEALEGNLPAGEVPEAQRQRLLALHDSLEAMEARMAARFPRYAQLRGARVPATLAGICRSLPGEQALVEYALGKEAVYAFVATGAGARLFRLPLESGWSLSQGVDSLLAGMLTYHLAPLSSPLRTAGPGRFDQQYGRWAFRLWEQLWAPFGEGLPGRVTIIPDGALGYLPFEALLTGPAEGLSAYHAWPYLTRKHTLSYAYSARSLMAASAAPAASSRLLAVRPGYGSGEAAASRKYDFRPLPASRQEVAAIRALTGARLLEEEAATWEAFVDQSPNYQILHFSGHGKVNDASPANSFLAFSAGPGEEGLLYLPQISHLRLDADLVVLSACETGIGRLYRGEGIASLARGFFQAGARSIVTSLWQVGDESTAQLMEQFYRELAQGRQKDEALRAARLHMIDKQGRPPYAWAGFVSLGDMGPLKLQGAGGLPAGLPAALLAAAALLAFALWRRLRPRRTSAARSGGSGASRGT
jgi:tetratricopeptide (TPR) repeat protein